VIDEVGVDIKKLVAGWIFIAKSECQGRFLYQKASVRVGFYIKKYKNQP
jgi:hypothetical protein